MVTIPPFWNGARAWARGSELSLLARRLGGRERVHLATQADLLALGVPASRADAWLGGPAGATAFQALTWADAAYPEALRDVPDPP